MFLETISQSFGNLRAALEVAPDDRDVVEAMNETKVLVARANQAGEVDPERQKRALEDPEVQAILRDPEIQSILQQLENNPGAAQAALQNPGVLNKLETLIAAGIIRMG